MRKAEVSRTTAETALSDLDSSYSGRSTADIDADIAALDPAATDYQDQLDNLTAERTAAADYETQRATLEADVASATDAVTDAEIAVTDAETAATDAAATEEEALLSASNGRELSDPALDYLRDQLGL